MSIRVARQFQLVAEINNACAALERVTIAMARQTGKERIGSMFAHTALHSIMGKAHLVDMPYRRYLCPEAKEVDYFKKWQEQMKNI